MAKKKAAKSKAKVAKAAKGGAMDACSCGSGMKAADCCGC